MHLVDQINAAHVSTCTSSRTRAVVLTCPFNVFRPRVNINIEPLLDIEIE